MRKKKQTVSAKRLKPALALLCVILVVAGVASAAVVQRGPLRVTVLTQIAPFRLPRSHPAPISVFVAGHVASKDGGIPPQLKRMEVMVNRHGKLQSKGLPVCRVPQIRTASSQKALEICAPALIGSGRFWAHIVLPDQPAYPTQGRLLIFNGRAGRKPLLLAHIFTSNPFPSSFVIAFTIRHISKGPYGTLLSAPLPQALGDWGYVDRIKLNLKRTYRFKGRQLSYFNGACPAPAGADRAAYPLARSSFYFASEKPLQATIIKACGVRE